LDKIANKPCSPAGPLKAARNGGAAADLRAGIHNDKYALNFFATNRGNERGELSSVLLAPQRRVAIIRPRTVGFSRSTKF
jgi:hypothetical protein